MFAKNLAQGFTGTFKFKERLSRDAFIAYAATLLAGGILAYLLLGAVGVAGRVLSSLALCLLFVSAVWRRRNDTGHPAWTSLFWVLPTFLLVAGQIVGPPVPKPVPEIPAGLGDAGLFLFLTPEFGNTASVAFENSMNELKYNVLYLVFPAVIAITLLVVEFVVALKPTKDTAK